MTTEKFNYNQLTQDMQGPPQIWKLNNISKTLI